MIAFLAKIKTGALAALAFIALLLGVWFGGRRSGKTSEQMKRTADELEQEKQDNHEHVETRNSINDVKDGINSLPNGSARRRLNDGWMRGDGKG